jgi:hypothetical protein
LTSWFCADRFARTANLDVLPDRKVFFFVTQWRMRVAPALVLRNGDREKLAGIASAIISSLLPGPINCVMSI